MAVAMNWSATVATTNDLKNGMTLDIEGQLWTVVEFQHVKPGKGPAFVRTKLKQVMTGKVVDKTFNAGVKVEIAILEKREMNFLYKEGEDFIFMDNENFDQMTISAATVGEAANYMLENTEAIVAIHENNPLYIELAASVELTVTYTEPGLQGDRSSGGTKPATVETGIEVQVPLFIKQDEKILVDTRDGSYQGRAN
jgi:elongation factor P